MFMNNFKISLSQLQPSFLDQATNENVYSYDIIFEKDGKQYHVNKKKRVPLEQEQDIQSIKEELEKCCLDFIEQQ